jgi:hypothetical protein
MRIQLFQDSILFHRCILVSVTGVVAFSVTPDGQRFLINAVEMEPNEPMTVVVNWAATVTK